MSAVNIFAPSWDRCDSYGWIALSLAERLVNAGITVNMHGNGLPTPRKEKGGICLGYPTMYKGFGADLSRPCVAVSMFESTELPEGWVDVFNQCKAVVVPSQWVKHVFKQNGVTSPLHVVPLGIRDMMPQRRPTGRKPFTFLAVADRGHRKGFDLAIKAWRQGKFARKDKYKLILKARAGMFKHVRPNPPNIEIVEDDLSDKDMQKLFYRTDCLISASRGEGLNLWPLEYIRSGGPVIATAYSGHTEFTDYCYALRYKLSDAWFDAKKFEGLGKWAEPDLDHLIELMHFVAQPDPRIQDTALRNAHQIIGKFNWDRFAQQVRVIWESVA